MQEEPPMKNTWFPFIAIVLSLPISVSGSVLTVGHSTGHDYQTITSAMAGADSGDEIRVAAGTYNVSDPTYPETFPIMMKAGVKLIRMTDDSLPVIDAEDTNRVLICQNIPPAPATRIEGFSIRGGWQPATRQASPGAGLTLDASTISIALCEFSDNWSEILGGGIGIFNGSSLELSFCSISGNRSDTSGGGIFTADSNLTMASCTVSDNLAVFGAGIYSQNSSLLLSDCRIQTNSADMSGGGVFYGNVFSDVSAIFNRCDLAVNTSGEDGGAIYISAAPGANPARLSHCLLRSNSAGRHGGGIFSENSELQILFSFLNTNSAGSAGGAAFTQSASMVVIGGEFATNDGGSGGGGIFGTASTLTLFDCLFDWNTVHEFGGGVSAIDSQCDVTNCTFNGNHASDGGGAISQNGGSLAARNSILWSNEIDEVFVFSGTTTITYSDIQGGYAGTGNIDEDPVFIEAYNGFYFLSQIDAGQSVDSPCLNAGGGLSAETSFTLNNEIYLLSEASTRTDRVHDTGQVDMGIHFFQNAYECEQTRCDIIMPSSDFGPGDACYCDVVICSSAVNTMEDMPVFVILEIAGFYIFAPEFDDFSYYMIDILPGVQFIEVIPVFEWPSGAGTASGVNFYTGITNQDMTELVGDFGVFTFGWHQ